MDQVLSIPLELGWVSIGSAKIVTPKQDFMVVLIEEMRYPSRLFFNLYKGE